MTPAVATVLSARQWEHDLVVAARDAATVRLVLRAYRPEDVEREASRIDVLVAGSETTWFTPARLSSWRRSGMRVVGVFPAGDAPARSRLRAAGADEVLADDTPADAMLRAIRLLQPRHAADPEPEGRAPVVVVTGPRGAPGRTEVALSVALQRAAAGPAVLIDLDLEAPALAVRLGLPPRPDVTDAAEEVHVTGEIPGRAIHTLGTLRVVVGSHRQSEEAQPDTFFTDVVTAAALGGTDTVVDAGPRSGGDPLLSSADEIVLVVEGTPNGLVRAASLVAEWTARPPRLVLNRVPDRVRDDVVGAARRWIGLEPEAVIGDLRSVARRSRESAPPGRALRRALRPVGVSR
jgi:hypothetical protein